LQNWNLIGCGSFFRLKAEQQLPAGLEEMPHVTRNDHSHYSHYRAARRLHGIGGGPFYGTGYYGGGGLGLIVVILLILLLLGKL